MKKKYNSLIIAGPTASGKTSLAVGGARLLDGEIISADSRQVYRGMDIGTGKDLAEYSRGGAAVPVHLIDCADPSETYSLYNYLHDFYPVFESILERNHVPVVCGGTGLYIEAALARYSVSDVPPDEKLRSRLMKLSHDDLIQRLRNYPDLFSECDVSSKKRVVRSLEIASYDGTVSESVGRDCDIRPYIAVLSPDRDKLKIGIAARLQQRFDSGMIEEVEALMLSGVTEERMLMFGMEYRYITLYLMGRLTREKMADALLQQIFRLAKRQRTWFRGMERRGFTLHWYDSINALELVERFNEA
ncbi:MAG: tRNA (adenosine(37)-N6)-dimethylallyltransferase MiaA [Spirochaetes bacterium]|nr:tRNA (adenosine(37)-N6)-dimethylallyltransferase MiaA [Spirochaetota bacterium]